MFLVVQEKNDIILFVVGFLDRVTKTYMEKFGKEMIGYCGGFAIGHHCTWRSFSSKANTGRMGRCA